MRIRYILLPALMLLSTALFAAERRTVHRVCPGGKLKVSVCPAVKLAGVRLPGGFRDDKLVEYFNFEAHEALGKLLTGRKITIDYARPRAWIFPRGEAYVYLDTLLVNAWLLRQGYARWDGKGNHRLAGDFAAYEREARRLKKGLWLSPFNSAPEH